MANKNQLYYGDNLDVLQRHVRDNTFKPAPRSRAVAASNMDLPLERKRQRSKKYEPSGHGEHSYEDRAS
jgi:hypothetical protein